MYFVQNRTQVNNLLISILFNSNELEEDYAPDGS